MPPKTKITKEKIIQAAFEIARAEGIENVNARSISQKLDCSTQPVLYHFTKVEDIRIAAHKLAEEYHIKYVTDLNAEYETPMLEVGMRYIKFSVQENNLFRYLFLSNYYSGVDLFDYLSEKNLRPVFEILKTQANLNDQEARTLFSVIFLVVHGISSLLANNSMVYEEEYCIKMLSNAYFGTIGLIQSGDLF
ncbi:MAG: TetR/AcrR family transcriptional regulator [Peptostreptococcaceae bacterium]|nr:TetR/AcrR family transcriptional regulator [Peptostreptococcaceae bacterium]